jgi:hypothetical protein
VTLVSAAKDFPAANGRLSPTEVAEAEWAARVKVVRIETSADGQKVLRNLPQPQACTVDLDVYVDHGQFRQYFLIRGEPLLTEVVLSERVGRYIGVSGAFLVLLFAFCYSRDAVQVVRELLPCGSRNVAVVYSLTRMSAILVQDIADGEVDVTCSSSFVRSFVQLSRNCPMLCLGSIGDFLPDVGVEGGDDALALPLGVVYPSPWAKRMVPPLMDVGSLAVGWTVDVPSLVEQDGSVISCDGLLVAQSSGRFRVSECEGALGRPVLPLAEARCIAMMLCAGGALTDEDLVWSESLFRELAGYAAPASDAGKRPWAEIRKAAHAVWPDHVHTYWLMEALLQLAWKVAEKVGERVADGLVATAIKAGKGRP